MIVATLFAVGFLPDPPSLVCCASRSVCYNSSASKELDLFRQAAWSMKTVSAHQANHEFSDLLLRVERREEVLITKRSKPVAVLSPYRQPLMTAKVPFNIQSM